jgi:hypothetical protein
MCHRRAVANPVASQALLDAVSHVDFDHNQAIHAVAAADLAVTRLSRCSRDGEIDAAG